MFRAEVEEIDEGVHVIAADSTNKPRRARTKGTRTELRLVRTLGIFLLTAFALLLAVGVYSLFQAQQISELMSDLGVVFRQPLDAGDWHLHWVLSSALIIILAAVGLVTSTVLIKRDPRGLLLLALLATGVFVFEVIENQFASYQFETTSVGELTATLVVGGLSWGSYFRLRRSVSQKRLAAPPVALGSAESGRSTRSPASPMNSYAGRRRGKHL